MRKAFDGFVAFSESVFDLEVGAEWRDQTNELSNLSRVKSYMGVKQKLEVSMAQNDQTMFLTALGV